MFLTNLYVTNLTNIKEMPELAEMIQRFEWDDCICTLLCKRDPSEKDIQDPLFQEMFGYI